MAGKFIALPKGVSEESFAAAVAEFRRVLGQDAVLVTAEQLAPYIKTMMPVPMRTIPRPLRSWRRRLSRFSRSWEFAINTKCRFGRSRPAAISDTALPRRQNEARWCST